MSGQAIAWVQAIKISVKGILHKKTGVLKKKAMELTMNEKAIWYKSKFYPLNGKNNGNSFLKSGVVTDILEGPFHIDKGGLHIINHEDRFFIL